MRTRVPILLVPLLAAVLFGAGTASAAPRCPQFVRATPRSLPAVVAVARSWVVFYLRPHNRKNPAFADGVSYVARTPTGFRVWYRYR